MVTVLWVLGVMWSVGCIVGALYAAYTMFDESIPLGLVALCIGLPIACLLAAIPWAIAQDMKSPDLATLKKGEWICAQSRIVNSTMVMSTGKTATVVPTTRSECITYSRIG